MTGLIPIVLLGALIVAFGFRLLVQHLGGRNRQRVTIDDYASAREALDSVFIETAAIRRIFSTDDMNFVTRIGTRDVQRLFLKERKALALQWLQEEQKRVAQLMDLHLRLASYTYDPSPRLELRLSAQYFAFVIVSNLVLLLMWLIGPFQATRVIEYTARTAGDFCTIFSLRLQQINPTRLDSRESLVH